jgi:carbonic anhydrase/acetyltransferase-like protein (isoleucine patch superfamily)
MHAMAGSSITPFKGIHPIIGKDCFLANGAHLIGDLVVGEESSFWFNTVVRADCNFIRIGKRTNVQDGTVIHVTSGTGPTVIGNDVTIGHSAVIHACTIEDLVLIGMGSIILDGARIRSNSLVAAGSVVTPGKEFPEGVLIKGSPAVVARPLTPQESAYLKKSVEYYLEYARGYISG